MLCSVSNVSFLQWFRPGPRWVANRTPPEPIDGFTVAYTSDWIYKPVSY